MKLLFLTCASGRISISSGRITISSGRYIIQTNYYVIRTIYMIRPDEFSIKNLHMALTGRHILPTYVAQKCQCNGDIPLVK